MNPRPAAAQDKPDIVVIRGDDTTWYTISAYKPGVMGNETPDIDRIATGGALFTDGYEQQSCTAGRAAVLTGQSPIRTGLLKVGSHEDVLPTLLVAGGVNAIGRSYKVHLDGYDLPPALEGEGE